MDAKHLADLIGTGIELVGVITLVVGALLAFFLYLKALARKKDAFTAYNSLRRDLGKAILVGLELLVGADIIRSIALAPSLNSISILGMIVVIRTFLSWSLELEVTGKWPWQSAPPAGTDTTTTL